MNETQLLALNPQIAGRLTLLDETSSTNEVVKTMLREGRDRPVVIARSQSSGKGRGGRSFGSPPGTGLYLTMGIPPLPDPTLPLTALVGCCVARGIEATTRCEAQLKWVNDVLVNEKKVCGILCEAVPEGVAIGIGVNVNTPADYFEAAELPHATSLAVGGGEAVPLEAVAAAITREVDAMAAQIADPAYVRAEIDGYRSRLITLGREVLVIAGDGTQRRGRALDIDAQAELIVDFGGVREVVNFGDVSVRGIYGYV